MSFRENYLEKFAAKNAEIAKLLQDLLKFLAKTYKKIDLPPKSYHLDT